MRRFIICWAVCCATCTSPVMAMVSTPPSDADLQQTIATYRAEWNATRLRPGSTGEDFVALQKSTLDGLDLGSLTPAQVGELLTAKLLHVWDVRDEIIEHMTALKDDDTTVGATARVHRLFFLGGVSPEHRPDAALQMELMGDMFAHPALSAAVRSGEAIGVIDALRFVGHRPTWRAHRQDIFALADDLLACTDHRISFDFQDYFEVLSGIMKEGGAPEAKQRVQAIRVGLVGFMRNVLARADSGEIELDEVYTEYLGDSIALLDAAQAKGALIGAAAPSIDFTWSSNNSITTLAALEGQVVILDFWATWCGPCVASFPNVRSLQERYDGFPVTIIGVTSLQGAHHGPGGTIDCEDDPAREMRLMAEYIGQKEITWTIAFAEQPVYNPDYGVGGIPHVTIIAPDGTVRHNDLHPANPLPEKAAKIDAILSEFSLPTPAPLETEAEGDSE